MTSIEDRLRRDLPDLADAVDDSGVGADGGRSPAGRSRGRPLVAAAAALVVAALAVGGYGAATGDETTDVTADEGSTVPATTTTASAPEPEGLPAIVGGTVSVTVYSGRRNPTFELTPEGAAAVSSVIGDLPETDEVLPAGQLGFIGFRVDGIDDAGAAVTLDVRFGLVGVEAPTTTVLADPDDTVLEELSRLAVEADPSLAEVISTMAAGG